MLISVTLPSYSANPKLPSSLAKISHDELVLIELQGSLDVESKHPTERNGQFVGKLKIDEVTVSPWPPLTSHPKNFTKWLIYHPIEQTNSIDRPPPSRR